MSTVAESFEVYRQELADMEGDRWSPELFLFWLNEGLMEVYNLRPDMYSRTYTMRLEAGSVQRPCNCAKLLDVREFTDAAGSAVASATKIKPGQDKFFCSATSLAASVCTASATGAASTYDGPTSYERSAFSANEFYVKPPVPAKGDYYTNVVCSNAPAPLSLTDDMCVDLAAYPAVRAYVKAMAYATERESTTSRQWFDVWMNLFFKLLGLQKQVDDALYKRERSRAISSTSTAYN